MQKFIQMSLLSPNHSRILWIYPKTPPIRPKNTWKKNKTRMNVCSIRFVGIWSNKLLYLAFATPISLLQNPQLWMVRFILLSYFAQIGWYTGLVLTSSNTDTTHLYFSTVLSINWLLTMFIVESMAVGNAHLTRNFPKACNRNLGTVSEAIVKYSAASASDLYSRRP